MSSSAAMNNAAAGPRRGAGSPSPEFSGRLYSKRAREIQAQEGLTPPVWGPPTSGNSTPLRETIPESPNGESFPDFNQPSSDSVPAASARRARADTLPSRLAPAASPAMMAHPSLLSQSPRPTPSTSPFKPGSTLSSTASLSSTATHVPAGKLTMLSRLRSGTLPQRPDLRLSSVAPLGNGMFASGWSSRARSSTLQSIPSQSSNDPMSPSLSHSRELLVDPDVKTLDYLGLVDTPQPTRATLAPSNIELLLESQRAVLNTASLAQPNRFRSYSVNAKEKFADDQDELEQAGYAGSYSDTLTPSGEAAAFALNQMVHQHNLEVQAFANLTVPPGGAGTSRPRAQTASVLDMRSTPPMPKFRARPAPRDGSMAASDLVEDAEYPGLAEAVTSMHLGGKPGANLGDDNALDGPTRALWLGNIPSSTTVSSLTVIFNPFGPIESTRVLTHKNCGFVNFESLDSAVQAKSQLNGKEIFPGAGPVRIGYAKVPSAAATPGHGGLFPSPSPDPLARPRADASTAAASTGSRPPASSRAETANAAPIAPDLPDVRDDIIQMIEGLGAKEDERRHIAAHVDAIIQHDYFREIPPIEEPSHSRLHDAPRLRDIRKRIDNGSYSAAALEEVALEMLPEIAELSSDYLGNTVVQKLFEHCSEPTKEAMLKEIAPHMAKIGTHKNGTWAAQKIIDVAQSHTLRKMVVDGLRPYAVAVFLDQYGNYVMQGCLKYQAPLNDLLFEAMLSRLGQLAQGRYSARAMRACLESHYNTQAQQRMVAAAIALHSVQLATNANGALLLTWFLDTCNFPRRRTVLAPRLIHHIVHLCTHKVAFLTVLKIINQRNEPEARDKVLNALFFSPNDQVLEDILKDQSCGATLIFKVLTTPFFNEKMRADVVQNVRSVLLRIKAPPGQGYKRLMDEVNLPTRGSGAGSHNSHRDHSEPRPASKQSAGPSQAESPAGRSYYAGSFEHAGLQRSGSMESNGYEPFQLPNVTGPMFVAPAVAAPGNPPPMVPFPQPVLAAPRGTPFYPPVNGYHAPVSGMDAYRPVNTVAPPGMAAPQVLSPASFLPANHPPASFPAAFPPGMAPAVGPQGYPYGLFVQQHQQQAPGAQRRARR